MRTQSIGLLLIIGFITSCYRVPDQISPHVDYCVQQEHLHQLPSAFPSLSREERHEEWGREWTLGRAFACQLDLYRAITAFKCAEILVDTENPRRREIEYEILLCYFFGKKYDDAICAFEQSGLAHVDKSFGPYRDLLLILYECYGETQNFERRARIIELMEQTFPDTAHQLLLSEALREGSLDQLDCFAQDDPDVCQLLTNYYAKKKSVSRAQILNAVIPGAGYLYLGQRQSAMTAFLLNGLFIAAAWQFFSHGHTAAGIITAGFESGWYFGGIYGAGEEAKYYNEHIYEQDATALLNHRKLFPTLMLQYDF